MEYVGLSWSLVEYALILRTPNGVILVGLANNDGSFEDKERAKIYEYIQNSYIFLNPDKEIVK